LPGRAPGRSQSFTYDELNRLKSASTQATSGPHAWGLSFGYDIWANLLSATVTQGSAPMLSVGVNGKNQINNSGFTYDAAGNLLADGSLTITYDAENRMTTTAGVSYTYDGDGKRVRKSDGTLYWLGNGLDPLAESDAAGNITDEYVFFGGRRIARRQLPSGTLHFYFSDHLGSSNIVASATGQILDESDFYPFGGERVVVDTLPDQNYKFTGKERDSESGLDYFGARYYASPLGRFTSTDPKDIALRHLLNPQKLNKYTYVLNNPLKHRDPNGMEEITVTFRTFIPQKSVTVFGQTFSGDNRTFSTAATASSRTFITVRLETDASKRANPIINVTSGAGATHKLDANGNVVQTATATSGLPTATATRDADGNVVLNIQQSVKNPLTPQLLTPAIDANLTVTVPQDPSSVAVTGKADQFPAQELNVTRSDGNTTPVMQFQPAPGATPLSLALPSRDVNVKKETPQCSTDEKGRKVCSQ
jgi:RHS repeat-associated protein